VQRKGVTNQASGDMGILTTREAPRFAIASWRSVRLPLGAAVLAVVLVALAAIAARAWIPGFVIIGLALVALAAVASIAWPRATLLVVVLTPVFDRYMVSGLLPGSLAPVANLLSEAMLLGVGLIFLVRAWRAGALAAAFRHPTAPALAAFAGLGVISAVLNDVPWRVVILGLVFTLDAAAFFFLPRLIGYTRRQAAAAIGAVVALTLVAAAVAVLQGLLSPTIFGLTPSPGRFGEVYRLASIFDNPNVFGAFLVACVPFALIAAARLTDARARWAAVGVAFLLFVALWLTFSRGSWLALLVGVGAVLAVTDRRALGIGIVLAAVSFGTAVVMPRDLAVAPPEPGDPAPPERPALIDSTIDRVGTVGRGGDLRTLFVLNAAPILADHPLLGVGPGRYGGAIAHTEQTPIYERYDTDALLTSPSQRTVDNFWLHLLVEAGILGAAAFLAAILVPATRVLLRASTAVGWDRILLGGIAAGTAGLAVSSVTTMLLEANSIGFLFWFFLGLGSLLTAAVAVDRPHEAVGVDPVPSPTPAR
jgi:O-antigen ligase